MARHVSRVITATLVCAALLALGGCLYAPTWTPESPQEVEAYAREFHPLVYYP